MGGNHLHAGVFVKAGGLAGGQEDVAVVGKDQDGLGLHGLEGVQEALHGGVHGLAAVNHRIGPHLPEGGFQAFPCGNRHNAKGFCVFLEAPVHVILMVLERHVLHLDAKEFPPFAAAGKHRAGVFRMNVHLDNRAVPEKHQGISLRGQPGRYHTLVKMLQVHLGTLEPQQKLRAVTELQLAIFRKGVKINLRGLRKRRGLRFKGCLAPEGRPHSLCDGEEPGPAAVHYAGFLEHVQKLRRTLQRKVHAGYHQIHVLLYGRRAVGRVYAFPEHGEDGPFHRMGNGAVGFFHGSGHGLGEGLDIGLLKPLEGLSHTGEDAGKDDAGIAPGPQQHPGRHRCGHLGQRVSGGVGTGLDGHVHVVARIAVRNGKHIQLIDFLTVPLQPGGTALNQVQV